MKNLFRLFNVVFSPRHSECTHSFCFRLILFLIAMPFVATACHQQAEEEAPAEVEASDTIVMDEATVAVAEPEEEIQAEPVPAPAPRKVVAGPKPQKKTIYVESYDVKGLVWGHVTLEGETGSGTIHDSEENTYSVKCKVHGNELFAIDQNSRRYVFKLPASDN